MKKLIILSISLLFSNMISAQENIWMDSILNQIMLNEIEVFDSDFKRIKNHKIGFILTDTIENLHYGNRPKFVNTVFQTPFLGGIVNARTRFDTLTNPIDSNYLNFVKKLFDNNGYHLKDRTAFLINKRNVKRDDSTQTLDFIDNLQNTHWKIDKIELDNEEMKLDSCHSIFRLQLNEDFTFYQFYGNKQSQCSTQEMEQEKEVTIDDERAFFEQYFNKIQGHYLNFQQGNWQIENNKLQLVNIQKREILAFQIEKLNDDALHLKLMEMNYRIEMKKVSR